LPILRLDFPGFCIEAQSLGSQNFPLSSDRFYYTVQDFLDIIAENFFQNGQVLGMLCAI
jgi:hypothetical protein